MNAKNGCLEMKMVKLKVQLTAFACILIAVFYSKFLKKLKRMLFPFIPSEKTWRETLFATN